MKLSYVFNPLECVAFQMSTISKLLMLMPAIPSKYTIRKFKTGQTGRCRHVVIYYKEVPVEMKAWVELQLRIDLVQNESFGMNIKHFTSHSFRKGRAHTASLNGVHIPSFQSIGGWSSNTVLDYTRFNEYEAAKALDGAFKKFNSLQKSEKKGIRSTNHILRKVTKKNQIYIGFSIRQKFFNIPFFASDPLLKFLTD